MFTDADSIHMQRALALAARGIYSTSPNPRVGCVLVKDGMVIGEGFTQPAGADHAEIQALKNARGRGQCPSGATAYLSLEPCSYFGRTPPCTDALIDARIACVTVAMEDPNPKVSGRGLAKLRAAQIEVRCGLLAQEAQALNIGFVSRMQRHRPWVRIKIAASLDGRTALPTGQSQWITGASARTDGHAWRARACAILTGIGTVRQDDPQLTVRGIDTPRQPRRILVDSRLSVPLTARILQGAPPLIVCACVQETRTKKADALRAAGAEVIALTSDSVDAENGPPKVDLPKLLEHLGAREINELHVEAGLRLNSALLQAQCVDELLIYLAPCLLGEDAAGMFKLGDLPNLDAAPRLSFYSIERVGDDLRLIARLKNTFPT